MSLDAISQVAAAEEETRAKLAQARKHAQALVADAEREGAALLSRARASAQARVTDLLDQAEERSEAHTRQVLEQTKQDCEVLRTAAGERMNRAVGLIVSRVRAEGEGPR